MIEPGAMASEIDSPPWHSNDLIAPMSFACPTDGYCDTPCPACQQARYTGWSATLDVLVIRPTEGFSSNSSLGESIGSRISVQREELDGSGFQFRATGLGFEREQNLGFPSSDPYIDRTTLETLQLDLDFYQRIWVNDTNIVFGIGPRIAHLNRSYTPDRRRGTTTFFSNRDNSITAVGVGFGVGLDHSLYRGSKSSLSLIGYARQSWMTGENEVPNGSYSNESLNIREVGFGVEWRRRLKRGDLTVQAKWETQQWSGAGEYYQLDGAALSVGYQW